MVRPGYTKVVQVERDGSAKVFILDDSACIELIDSAWKKYVSTTYRNPGKRAREKKGDFVEHPVEVDLADRDIEDLFVRVYAGQVSVKVPKRGATPPEVDFLTVCRALREGYGPKKIEVRREEIHSDGA